MHLWENLVKLFIKVDLAPDNLSSYIATSIRLLEVRTGSDEIEESYQLARTLVYETPEGERLKGAYRFRAPSEARKRIALAGCQLAGLLKRIFGRM